MLQYKRFIFNPIQVNTWLLYAPKGDCLIFDPGCSNSEEQQELVAFISEGQLKPLAVIATHGHFDHVPGINFVKNQFGIPFLGHSLDQELVNFAAEQGRLFGFSFDGQPPHFDRFLEDGELLQVGQVKLKVLHVPGHSAGSLAFYSEESRLVLVGDVLFKGSIGRTDLPGGNYEALILSIRHQLLSLPDETIVLSGHGPETSIGKERNSNPFLR